MRLSRNRNSEYLPQRRKGRKVRRLRVKIIYKSFCPFPITLAPLREEFPTPSTFDARLFAQAAQIFNYSKYEGHESLTLRKNHRRGSAYAEKKVVIHLSELCELGRLCGEMFFGYGQKSIPLRIQKFLPPRLKNADCRLLKKISEARRAKNRRAEAYIGSTLTRDD